MTRFRVNIFHVISAICSLLLLGYLWFVFLPTFKDSPQYPAVQNTGLLLTVLLLVVTAAQFLLAIRKEETKQDYPGMRRK